MLGLVGVGVLGYGLFQTFVLSEIAGLVGLAILAVMLPTGLVVAVKNWHRTPVGRRISPPNPQLGDEDRMPIDDLGGSIYELNNYGGIRFDTTVAGDGVTFPDNSFVLNSRGISDRDGAIALVNARGGTRQIMVTLGGAVRSMR